MASRNGVVLQFGIEIELLIRPRPGFLHTIKEFKFDPKVRPRDETDAEAEGKRQKDPGGWAKLEQARVSNRMALYRGLVRSLTNIGVTASADRGAYDRWTITQDPALTEIPVPGQCGFWNVELVSRILRTDENWAAEVALVYTALAECCEIKLTTGCSMHVHVSPVRQLPGKPDQFTYPEIANIIKAVAYFDEPLTDIMPAERKQNAFALSSFTGLPPADDQDANDRFNEPKMRTLRSLYHDVPAAGWGPLFQHLEKVRNGISFRQNWDLYRLRSFNFSPLLDENCLTIEFRRPPGVDTAAKATKWTSVALCFFASAIDSAWNVQTSGPPLRDSKSRPTLKEFKTFLERGRTFLNMDSFDPNVLVANKDPALILTAIQIAKLKSKDAEMDSESVFESKLSSRSNTPTSQTSKHSLRGQSSSPNRTSGRDAEAFLVDSQDSSTRFRFSNASPRSSALQERANRESQEGYSSIFTIRS
ncbi:hypothetical protein QBC41DRAFT_351543 [Cercophora samala]|uniref:Amidoligase enzyme n=1 Tax=Cercophora samala TaxID=330535 RepID=A0AA40CWN9_9PEZI|nr:hypothetical protein QBC41DRAFT_351543 [Cercophora samala]